MITEPLIVSFFTKDTIYEKEVQELIESCNALQIPYKIEALPDLGSWQKNCCHKPLFIRKCLSLYKRPLFWVDADAILLKAPQIPASGADIGFYFNCWEEKKARSGTIFAAPTKTAFEFLDIWYKACSQFEDFPQGDQHFVQESLLQMPHLHIENLPRSYTHVFDKDPTPLKEVYILHTQASRTARMDPIFWNSLTSKELKQLRIANSPLLGLFNI